ncbi:glycosyltransferase family 2 protein [Brumimicrobium aurantiacum]|uniref:Glycosyltransferase n=1 Tax=Brumimicrobium aurantiacum TaxID=1737063 RepID=A0A3E1F1P1_9FLAO|nr:glycosyltransferase family 2 protein [Brumimicrobium aurantiacum]RFC55738.1 glycosyltransferase [Brumimicrobium aurantiacum]
MNLSIVSTLYKSEVFLDEFLTETITAINSLDISDFEIIFVNDGSPDNSLIYLIEKKKEIPQIKIIDLSRNFGHHYAMQVGLQQAIGEYVFLIDNDLEVSPDFLIDCFKELSEDASLDVVYGFQQERKGRFIENIGGRMFWWAINKFSDVNIPKNILTERLMTRKYVDSLLLLGDANLFLGGMMYWVGYNQKSLPVEKKQRKGESTYSTRKRMELMIQAVTSFSGKPLEYLFYSGILITFGSLLTIVYYTVKKLIYGDSVQLGWTSLISLNVLILGIISTFLGLIGIYIFKIFKQVQNRPNAIIKNIY